MLSIFKYWNLVSFQCLRDFFCQDESAKLILCREDMPGMTGGGVNEENTIKTTTAPQKRYILNNKE